MNEGSIPKNQPSRRLILASESPRRRELLREHGYVFEVMAPPPAEPQHRLGGVSPAAFAEAVSFFKAAAVAHGAPDGLILAGDTIVALGEVVFGKPVDREDARQILARLAGTTHEVITGVTLLDAGTRRRWMAHDSTQVTMRPLNRDELERYLDSNEWKGKAGAYGIQDCGDAFIEHIEGSFSNVVGLPLELVSRMLNLW